MSIDGGVSSGASEVLVLAVGDMEMSLGIPIFLGQAEVNDVDLIATFTDAHEEVIGLDVAVDEGLSMDVLDAGDELVGEEEDRLQGELPVTEVEKILQAGAQKVQDHGIVVTLGAKPADERDADTAGQGLVDSGFILKLGMLGLDALKLNGNFLPRDNISAQVNIAERARTDLSTDAVLVTDT